MIITVSDLEKPYRIRFCQEGNLTHEIICDTLEELNALIEFIEQKQIERDFNYLAESK